jgi:hypothetical protein
MDSYNNILGYISHIEDMIEDEKKRLSDALLYIGFDKEKELFEIDSISEKIRTYVSLIDELYLRLEKPRVRVDIPDYHHLHMLSPSKNLSVFFRKLSGELDKAYIIWEDERIVALEK